MNGKTKSGLTPQDLTELAAAKKTLLKFSQPINDSLPFGIELDFMLDAIDELLMETVE